MTQIQPTRIAAATINAMQDEIAGAISPEDRFNDVWRRHKHQIIAPTIPLPTPARRDQPASDELHALAASANRIDMIIAVFAIGVLFGTWI